MLAPTTDVLVSVCIVSRDGDPPIAVLLAAFEEQTAGADAFEIVVVDASSNGLNVKSDLWQLDLHVVDGDADMTHGQLHNVAWRAARGAEVAFLAADLVPNPTWVEAFEAALRRGRHLVRGGWLPASEGVRAGGAVPRTLWWSTRSLPVVTSDQMACLRADLELVGGFADNLLDPDVCDTDLAARLVDAGVDPVWARHAVAYHPVVLGSLSDARDRARRISTVLAEHPRARGRLLLGGVLWHRYQATLLLLLAGVGLVGRDRRALLLALPWLHERTCQVPRAGGPRRRWAVLPGVLAFDVAETGMTMFERFRHRGTS